MKHKLYTASGSVPDTYVVQLKSTKGHTYVRKWKFALQVFVRYGNKKLRAGSSRKNLSSEDSFLKSHRSESHTLLKRVNEFLSALSTLTFL